MIWQSKEIILLHGDDRWRTVDIACNGRRRLTRARAPSGNTRFRHKVSGNHCAETQLHSCIKMVGLVVRQDVDAKSLDKTQLESDSYISFRRGGFGKPSNLVVQCKNLYSVTLYMHLH